MIFHIFRNTVLKRQIIGSIYSLPNMYRDHKDSMFYFKRRSKIKFYKNNKEKKSAWGDSTIDLE